MSQEIVERTFETGAAPRLYLANIRGSVEIQPGPDGQIAVIAAKQLDSGDPGHTQIEMSQAADGSVSVRTRFQEGGWNLFFLRWPSRVDYTVRVPAVCSLRVEGVSNTASIRGVRGELQVVTVSGELSLKDLSGTIKVNTVSGDIAAEGLSGPLRLEAVSGDARLDRCSLPSLEASTVSGDLSIQTDLREGPYRFNSVSGDVHLTLPAGTGCTVRSESLSGSVKTDQLTQKTHRNGGQRYVQVLAGGVEIHHNSVSGDLRLTTTQAATPVNSPVISPADQTPDLVPQHNRLAILEQIERGELTVEEGLHALST